MLSRILIAGILVVLSSSRSYAQDLRVMPCADLYPFYHGVASGDPLHDRVIIWTRVSPDEAVNDIDVTWRIALDTGMTQLIAQGTAVAALDHDLTVKVDVTGLQPNTFYYYDFVALDHHSVRGRTKTLPIGNLDRLRMAVAACSNYEHGYFNGYKYLAERNDIDVVLHLGDYIYEYATGGYSANLDDRNVEPSNETISLEDYRIRHSHYKLDADLRAAHQQFPWITVWDDHESANDAWFGGAQNHNAGEGDWFDRKAASMKAYYEWLPVRGTPEEPLYRSFDFGGLVHLVMLDTRLEGRDEQVPTTSADLASLERTLLGQAQKSWLENEITGLGSEWLFLGQQVMMAPLMAFGQILNADQWDGYQADRSWLYDKIQLYSLGKTIVLTGDIHTAWVNELPLSNYNPNEQLGSAGVEFVCTSVTSPGLPSIPAAVVQLFNAHVRYVNLSEHGFIVVECAPTYVHTDFVFVNTLTEPGGGVTIGASYRTEQGTPYATEAGMQLPMITFDSPFAPACPLTDSLDPARMHEFSRNMTVTGVYPNPWLSALQVQFGLSTPDQVEVRLIDQHGAILFSKTFGRMAAGLHYIELHLPELPNGVYMLQCVSSTEQSVHRVVRAG